MYTVNYLVVIKDSQIFTVKYSVVIKNECVCVFVCTV